MNGFRKIARTSKALVEFIIALIGVICILTDSLKLHTGALSGIGTSLFASAIVVFLSDFLLGSDDETQQWGLVKVYPTRGEMNYSCDRFLQKAKRVDAIAFGMKSWRSSQKKSIERILKQGGNIRIITMEPDCEILKAREKDEDAAPDEIAITIRHLFQWSEEYNAKGYPGKIYIRCHRHIPQDFLFIMDNRAYTGPYEYGKPSQQTLSFEYKNSGKAYEYYSNRFDELWNDPRFCHEYKEKSKAKQ